MIQVSDSIEGSGHPLGFCFRRDGARDSVAAKVAGETVFRVDARAMGAHQKEALVYEGNDGPVWRLVSDEGPYLNGTDMAPFPLGFFNAGLQADLLGWLARLISERGIGIDAVDLEIDNTYSFSGSFIRGDGRGSAEAAQIRLAFSGSATIEQVSQLVKDAMAASPAIAAVKTALSSTFALYVNGIRRQVRATMPSAAVDASDPLKIYRTPPHPVDDGRDVAGIISKDAQPVQKTEVMPSAGTKFDLRVLGTSRLTDVARGRTEVQTWLKAPAGSRFGFQTDELSVTQAAAPSGLALLSAGVAFCYVTQLLRYAEYLKYKVRAIRMVQYNPYRLQVSAGASLVAAVGPVDTHLFLHGDESDEVMQKLLVMGAQTCYLHAALKAALLPVLQVRHNGVGLNLQA